MLAYTYVSKEDFRLMEKPEPVLEDGKDAIVRVEYPASRWDMKWWERWRRWAPK